MPDHAQPDNPRKIGRSRTYTSEDIPERLYHWHAPRINRWERLCVTAGQLRVEWLDATAVTRADFAAGDSSWFAPGTRWRVADIPLHTSFELEIHADSKGQADEPQLLRSTVLEDAPRAQVTSATQFHELTRNLPAGERRLVTAQFGAQDINDAVFDDRRLFWHPLEKTTSGFMALVARGEQDFNLVGYMGRDHAVIEAALAAALAGHRQSRRWLHATLARHLRIEETILFPAYVAAGGNKAWASGLIKEHGYLREFLADIDAPGNRRKFLRLLDGHDEKEERVVYPDILEHLGNQASTLLPQIIRVPV